MTRHPLHLRLLSLADSIAWPLSVAIDDLAWRIRRHHALAMKRHKERELASVPLTSRHEADA